MDSQSSNPPCPWPTLMGHYVAQNIITNFVMFSLECTKKFIPNDKLKFLEKKVEKFKAMPSLIKLLTEFGLKNCSNSDFLFNIIKRC